MSKQTKILLLVAGLVIAGYFVFRWYQNQQSGNPQGLGSNLNSPAPNLSAAPSVGPAVSIPVTISVTHDNSGESPPESANPFSAQQASNNVVGQPGSLGASSRKLTPAQAGDVYGSQGSTQHKTGGTYATRSGANTTARVHGDGTKPIQANPVTRPKGQTHPTANKSAKQMPHAKGKR